MALPNTALWFVCNQFHSVGTMIRFCIKLNWKIHWLTQTQKVLPQFLNIKYIPKANCLVRHLQPRLSGVKEDRDTSLQPTGDYNQLESTDTTDLLYGGWLHEWGSDPLLDCEDDALAGLDTDRGWSELDSFNCVLNLEIQYFILVK